MKRENVGLFTKIGVGQQLRVVATVIVNRWRTSDKHAVPMLLQRFQKTLVRLPGCPVGKGEIKEDTLGTRRQERFDHLGVLIAPGLLETKGVECLVIHRHDDDALIGRSFSDGGTHGAIGVFRRQAELDQAYYRGNENRRQNDSQTKDSQLRHGCGVGGWSAG